MTDDQPLRTLYVLVDYTPDGGTTLHTRGTALQFHPDDRDANGLILRGILSPKPVRREAGDTKQ